MNLLTPLLPKCPRPYRYYASRVRMAKPPGKQPSGQSGQSVKSGQQVHERTWPRFASLLNMRVAPDSLALFAQGLCGVTRKCCVRGLVWVGRPCDR